MGGYRHTLRGWGGITPVHRVPVVVSVAVHPPVEKKVILNH